MIFVSVVIPAFNALRYLGECLEALEAQTYPRDQYEVIVADNGSTDGTREFVARAYPRVRLVDAPRKGSGYARNEGIEQARSELILNTDSDCVPASDWIAAFVEAYASASQETAFLGGPIIPYSTQTMVEKYRETWVQPPEVSIASKTVLLAATANAALRKSVWLELGGFDGEVGHDDTDFGMRLTAAGYQIGFTEEATVRHHNPADLRTLLRHRAKYGESNFKLAMKHPDVFGDPSGAAKRRTLLLETVFRIGKDVVKLPISYAIASGDKPRGWPMIDAVIAWGNYDGFQRASRSAK